MADAIKLFFAFARVSMLTQMEYRLGYVVRMAGKVIDFGGSFAILAIMLFRFQSIGTWSAHEVLFLYSLNILTYSVAATFTMPICNIGASIRSGTMDAALTRPVNPLYLIICQNASAGYITNYLLGLGVMVFALVNLQIEITFASVALLVLSIMGGILIHAAALIACGVPSFWTVKNNALPRIFYWEFNRFVDYPINIYSGFIQGILTFVLPYAFISFYPAGLFLGRTDDTIFHPVIFYLSPLVGIVCFALAYRFWKFGLDAYQSTGS